jgi:ribonucleotide monophosphatase NagD (HAD superfamily)
MGGMVRHIGKPDPAIYRPVQAMLDTSAKRTLAIGDSLATDIAGAAAAGVDSCWVLGGIHADSARTHTDAETLLAVAGLSPVATVPGFIW